MTPENILRKFQLRNTVNRISILQAFMLQDCALSQSDLEKELKDVCDRVTIYRTLDTFLEKGVIHRVLDEKQSQKFALCREECTENEHDHEHVHFKCTQCEKTTCLEEIKVAKVTLPEGYHKIESNFVVLGVCRDCTADKLRS